MGAEAPPAVKVWYEKLKAKDPESGAFIHRLLIVTELKDGKFLAPKLDYEAFSEKSFLELLEAREVELGALLNQRGESSQDYSPPKDNLEKMFDEVFRFTSADTIIYAPKDGEHWSFYRRDDRSRAKKEFMIKGPEENSAEAIKKWLIAKLGYTGIVLAQDDKYLLVGTYQQPQEGASAMLILDSDKALRIKKSQMEGSALLRRLDCQHNICVFEILIQSKNSYPVGSKIFF